MESTRKKKPSRFGFLYWLRQFSAKKLHFSHGDIWSLFGIDHRQVAHKDADAAEEAEVKAIRDYYWRRLHGFKWPETDEDNPKPKT